MNYNNTDAIPFFRSQVPQSYLGAVAQLAGMGAVIQELTTFAPAETHTALAGVSDSLPPAATDAVDMTTKINAELFYVGNLYRNLTGQPPLPSSAAPTVQVGISEETKKMLIVGGGIGLLALAMALHGKR